MPQADSIIVSAAKSTPAETPFETPVLHLLAHRHRADFETSNGDYEHEYLDRPYAANATRRETDPALAASPGTLGKAPDHPNRRTNQGMAPSTPRSRRVARHG